MKPDKKDSNSENDEHEPDSGGRGDTWGPHQPQHDRYPDEENGGYLA